MKLTEAERRARGEEIMARFSTSRAPAGEPSPHDSLGLEQAARREWETNAAIRVEFGDSFERYLAFYKADRKGLVKIFGRKA